MTGFGEDYRNESGFSANYPRFLRPNPPRILSSCPLTSADMATCGLPGAFVPDCPIAGRLVAREVEPLGQAVERITHEIDLVEI